MKRWEFKLPDIGEGVTEGEIVAWADGIAEGVVVQADQALAEVMTDKATVTITSPKTGTIVQLGGAVGQVIAVGAPLVVLDLDAGASASAATPAPAVEAPAAPAAAEPKKESGNAATAVGDIKEDLPGMNRSPAPAAKKAVETTPSTYFAAKPLATPATRKLARELGVDLRTVPPSGPHGRVTKDDVRARTGASTAASPSSAPSSTATANAATSAPAQSNEVVASRFAPMKIAAASAEETALETREPLRGVRKKIFDSMSRSKHTAAHFTFVEECDVTALKDLRARLRPAAEKEGVKLTYLPFIVKATVAALKRHPELNSAFDESTQEIVRRAYINLGIASSTEAGLIVPVVKGADRRSILDIAREIQRLGEATKSGKVKAADLQGSTFTITSLGQQGGLFATPILNFPEVGILGVHQIKQKPVVRDNQIVIGEVMLLSLSFDHRIIDGHVGAAFAYEIIRFLEDPDALFLEMA
jgi:pyruvate dehydrogenase E2 component (dihydrolipoamide acetyltransferase)